MQALAGRRDGVQGHGHGVGDGQLGDRPVLPGSVWHARRLCQWGRGTRITQVIIHSVHIMHCMNFHSLCVRGYFRHQGQRPPSRSSTPSLSASLASVFFPDRDNPNETSGFGSMFESRDGESDMYGRRGALSPAARHGGRDEIASLVVESMRTSAMLQRGEDALPMGLTQVFTVASH